VLVVSAIEYTVELLLTQALSPVIAAIDGYVALVNDTLAAANATVADGGAVTSAEALAVAQALSGPVFQGLMDAGVMAEVALALLAPVDIGPELIVPILIALVVTVALHAVATSPTESEESTLTSGFSVPAIHAAEDMVNATQASQKPAYGSTWQTLVEVTLLMMKVGLEFPTAMGLLAIELRSSPSPLAPTITFSLGMLGMILTLWSVTHPPAALPILALAIVSGGIASCVALFKGLRSADPATRALYFVDGGIGVAGTLWDLYVL
jgi:hypothetical protein